MSDQPVQPDVRDEKRKRTKQEIGNEKRNRKKPVPVDSKEGSGSDHGSDQEEEAMKEVGSGGGEFGRKLSIFLSVSLSTVQGFNLWLKEVK